MRALCLVLILVMACAVGFLSFYTGKGTASANAAAEAVVAQKKIENEISEITYATTIAQDHIFAEFSGQVIRHCDTTVAAFLSNDEYDIKLELLFVPKLHAMDNYDQDDETTLVWRIPQVAPPGVYKMSVHVLNKCNPSAESVKLDDNIVEIIR